MMRRDLTQTELIITPGREIDFANFRGGSLLIYTLNNEIEGWLQHFSNSIMPPSDEQQLLVSFVYSFLKWARLEN